MSRFHGGMFVNKRRGLVILLTYSLVYVVSAVWTNWAEHVQKADLFDVEEGVIRGFTTLEPS